MGGGDGGGTASGRVARSGSNTVEQGTRAGRRGRRLWVGGAFRVSNPHGPGSCSPREVHAAVRATCITVRAVIDALRRRPPPPSPEVQVGQSTVSVLAAAAVGGGPATAERRRTGTGDALQRGADHDDARHGREQLAGTVRPSPTY